MTHIGIMGWVGIAGLVFLAGCGGILVIQTIKDWRDPPTRWGGD